MTTGPTASSEKDVAMPSRPQQTEGDLRNRIVRAALQVVLNNGTRQTKSFRIAEVAGTSESTMFRYFKDLEALFQAAYDRSWQDINEYLYQSSFENPVFGDPRDQLIVEFDRLWALLNKGSDEKLRDSATVAFTYLLRPLELGRDYRSENQQMFQKRVAAFCHGVVASRTSAVGADTLQEMLTNFAATVWLTAQLVPSAEQLSPEVARLGVTGLIDRLTGTIAGGEPG
jgi:AcrR family transcriptional regulator